MTTPRKNPDDLDTVLGHLRAALPHLDRDAAVAALRTAQADHWSSLARLVAYLRAHPDGVSRPDHDAPQPAIRLTYVLHTAGHHGVSPLPCASCGRIRPTLPSAGPSGRICGACKAKRQHAPCARCGQRRRVAARRPEGGICGPCYNAEPSRQEPCGQCGRPSPPSRRLPDGTALCLRCAPRPQHRCDRCGRLAPAARLGPDGATCYSCYRPPARRCGRCDRVRPVAKHATESSPDVCVHCWPGDEAMCVTCGRLRPCRGIRTGRPVCSACRVASRRTCARCGQARQIVANWPIGPVCQTCYRHIRGHPDTCPRCHTAQPLIAHDESGAAMCGPCAGFEVHYECASCGRATMLYSDNRCHRCVLTLRLTDLLAGGPDATVAPQLQPLIDALSNVDKPTSILLWLRHSNACRLLASLAASDQPISHPVLDNLPPSKAVHYVRDVLVTTGVLPARDEHLERITGFVNDVLAGVPAEHAAVIKPYTHWYLIRRARARSGKKPVTKTTAAGARARIRAAMLLLAWLDDHHLTLATLTQPDLEQWLATHPTRARLLQAFIAWTTRRGLTYDLGVPIPPRPQPHVFLSDEDRTAHLRRCLYDSSMPIVDRVLGALVLLFGIPVSRLAHLTTDNVHQAASGTRLQLGDHWLRLPPRLADLVTLLLAERPRPARSTLVGLAPNSWLFPGSSPTRPASHSGLMQRLYRQGIRATAGRNTARAALASRLPASVLADLTGVHIQTAIAWSRLTSNDWAGYVASRAYDLAIADTDS